MAEWSKAILHSKIAAMSILSTFLVGAGMGPNSIHSNFADIPIADEIL